MKKMKDQFERTTLLLGADALRKLKNARAAVFGIGGVGGACAEALARSGLGAVDLFDHDRITLTNLNRQIIALHSTLGMYKAEVMAARIRDINLECKAVANKIFYSPENADEFDLSVYDCVIDAIDSVPGKIELIVRAKAAGVYVISSMGAGNKIDPTGLTVSDIYKTEGDPLAKVIRKELRKRGIKNVPVVWSKEPPLKNSPYNNDCEAPVITSEVPGRPPIPSSAFVPPAAGLILAAEAVKYIISN